MGNFQALVNTGAYRAFQSGEWVMEQDPEDLAAWVSDATGEFTDATKCLPRVFTVSRDGRAVFLGVFRRSVEFGDPQSASFGKE